MKDKGFFLFMYFVTIICICIGIVVWISSFIYFTLKQEWVDRYYVENVEVSKWDFDGHYKLVAVSGDLKLNDLKDPVVLCVSLTSSNFEIWTVELWDNTSDKMISMVQAYLDQPDTRITQAKLVSLPSVINMVHLDGRTEKQMNASHSYSIHIRLHAKNKELTEADSEAEKLRTFSALRIKPV